MVAHATQTIIPGARMTKAILLSWLLALPPLHDGHGAPIPRPRAAAETIATVAMETGLPQIFAATLDVLAAHESGYRIAAVGDSGASCGAFQTPCARTPKDALGQTRLAVAILYQALSVCSEHTLWAYAAGRCIRSTVAVRYEREVRQELAIALPSDVAPALWVQP